MLNTHQPPVIHQWYITQYTTLKVLLRQGKSPLIGYNWFSPIDVNRVILRRVLQWQCIVLSIYSSTSKINSLVIVMLSWTETESLTKRSANHGKVYLPVSLRCMSGTCQWSQKQNWYNETEWVQPSWMSLFVSRGTFFACICDWGARLVCSTVGWFACNILQTATTSKTQMRILILGHLQNTLRCHEKKPECYCIFRLMGISCCWCKGYCKVRSRYCLCLVLESGRWRWNHRIMNWGHSSHECANYNFNIPWVLAHNCFSLFLFASISDESCTTWSGNLMHQPHLLCQWDTYVWYMNFCGDWKLSLIWGGGGGEG